MTPKVPDASTPDLVAFAEASQPEGFEVLAAHEQLDASFADWLDELVLALIHGSTIVANPVAESS